MIRLGSVVVAILFAIPAYAATIVPTRTTGVAPLIVHFYDSDGVVSSSPGNMPFHDREYSWTFDDTTSGTWGTNGLSKNADKGPVTAHVFETPGTYTVTLTVKNSSGTIGTDTQSITVTNPDTVFAGTLTTCISTGTNFTGCPSGATQRPNITTTLSAELDSATEAGERVLLRRGDTWTMTSGPSLSDNDGPVHIGAFGSCSSPDSLGICSNAPAITISGAVSFFPSGQQKKDWRVTDLSLSNSSKTGLFTNMGGGKNILVMRIHTQGFGAGYAIGQWRYDDMDYADGHAIVSSKFEDVLDMGIWAGGERMSIMGTVVPSTDDQHTVRIWQAYQSVISHNIFSGSGSVTHYGGHALKFHGPAEADSSTDNGKVGTFAETGNAGLRNHTQFSVISNNVFGGSGPWTVMLSPQNTVYDERLSDIIFEKNKLFAVYDPQGSGTPLNGMHVVGRYISVRNNIFDGTGSTDGYWAILVDQMADEATTEWPPLGHRIYNNTVYGNSAVNVDAGGVDVTTGGLISDTIVRNNLVSFPVTTNGSSVIRDTSGYATASNNLLTSTAYLIDPNNATILSRDFSLTSSSTAAIGQGYVVPVLDDFEGTLRGSTFDIGADEYGAEEEPPPVVNVITTGAPMSGGSIN